MAATGIWRQNTVLLSYNAPPCAPRIAHLLHKGEASADALLEFKKNREQDALGAWNF